MTPAAVCSAVAASLVLEEFHNMKALESLPSPEALMQRLELRTDDFNLLAGVAGAYLNERGIIGGCE